jgi:hypothetical protein
MKTLSLFIIAAVMGCGNAPAQQATQPFGITHQRFTVKLLSPISTKTSSEGDAFTAIVVDPPAFVGAVLEGKITKLKKPVKGVGKGKAEIAFEFNTLTMNSNSGPVSVDLKEVTNSLGVKNVDEEGRVIGKSSNAKRVGAALAGAGIGALVGGLAGGASGMAMGSAAGLGLGLAVGLKMTTTGKDLEFLPGSHFAVDISDRKANANRKL